MNKFWLGLLALLPLAANGAPVYPTVPHLSDDGTKLWQNTKGPTSSSYDIISTVYNPLTGYKYVDDGTVWASLSEVLQAFNEIANGTPESADDFYAIEHVFGYTFSPGIDFPYHVLAGYTRDGYVVDVFLQWSPDRETYISGHFDYFLDPFPMYREATRAVFAYTAVPEPATFGLMLLAVVGVTASRRSRRPVSAAGA